MFDLVGSRKEIDGRGRGGLGMKSRHLTVGSKTLVRIYGTYYSVPVHKLEAEKAARDLESFLKTKVHFIVNDKAARYKPGPIHVSFEITSNDAELD